MKLLETADVLVQNFRPGTMERLGLGAEQLAKRFPRLIYASISGVGETGPYEKKRVYDPINPFRLCRFTVCLGNERAHAFGLVQLRSAVWRLLCQFPGIILAGLEFAGMQLAVPDRHIGYIINDAIDGNIGFMAVLAVILGQLVQGESRLPGCGGSRLAGGCRACRRRGRRGRGRTAG